jgi:hypothetical protein
MVSTSRAAAFLLVPLLAACGASSGGSGGSALQIQTSSGAIRVDWSEVADATAYRIYWDDALPLDLATAPSTVVSAPPFVASGLAGTYHVAVAPLLPAGEGPPSATTSVDVAPPSPERYFPPWADVAPTNVSTFTYDGTKTSLENGARLASRLASLAPGDHVQIGAGTWSMQNAFRISAVGTAQAPIWITAAPGVTPVITRPDASQNALEIGTSGPARFLALRGLEIVGGDIAVRLHDCKDVWMDACHVRDCAQNAITANSHPTERLYFTRNEVHGTSGSGEGFYIGGNDGNPIASRCVIALNHVYDCGGSQGDGIEVKQGSWGNWIAENLVHDTNYPCILVYGTGGRAPNVVERNVCFGSNDNVMQVQGEAIVRNNVLFDGALAFHSGDHQGQTRDLVVVHNTFVNWGTAVNLASWGGRPGMVFSNNAAYSQSGAALQLSTGSQGVRIEGNVVYGAVHGTSAGFVPGNGLADFTGATWDGSSRDVTPSNVSVLAGAAAAGSAELEELDGSLRVPPYDAGAAERP